MELRPGMDLQPHVELRPLLVVDSDASFRDRLAQTLGARGFHVRSAGAIADARALLQQWPPSFVVMDIRLTDGNGLTLIPELLARSPEMRIVVLTGHGSIASAVAAMRLGVADYLTKPAQPAELVAALEGHRGVHDGVVPEERPLSPDRVRWEHIQRVYERCERNVSETARQLSMHRRTLQRILIKRPPR